MIGAVLVGGRQEHHRRNDGTREAEDKEGAIRQSLERMATGSPRRSDAPPSTGSGCPVKTSQRHHIPPLSTWRPASPIAHRFCSSWPLSGASPHGVLAPPRPNARKHALPSRRNADPWLSSREAPLPETEAPGVGTSPEKCRSRIDERQDFFAPREPARTRAESTFPARPRAAYLGAFRAAPR
jgi:hypothetical protein